MSKSVYSLSGIITLLDFRVMFLTMVEGLNLNYTCVLCPKYLASGLIEKLRNFLKNKNNMTVISADSVFDQFSELLYHVFKFDHIIHL